MAVLALLTLMPLRDLRLPPGLGDAAEHLDLHQAVGDAAAHLDLHQAVVEEQRHARLDTLDLVRVKGER